MRQIPHFFMIGLAFTIAACSQKPDDFEIQVSSNIESHYEELQVKAGQLNINANQCSEISNGGSLEYLKPVWQDTMSSWQRVQWVQFGPVTENSRQWQMQFWPDQKNIIGQKMKSLLSQDVITPAHLQTAGPITQGLSALEFLLYDKDAQQYSLEKRCKLTQLITHSMHDLTRDLNSDWHGYSESALAGSAAKPKSSTSEFTTDIVSSLVYQLTVMTQKKLDAPLALENQMKQLQENTLLSNAQPGQNKANLKQSRPNPYFLESWRSERSYENLVQNYQSIKTLLKDHGIIQSIKKKGHPEIAQTLSNQLDALDSFFTDTPLFSMSSVQNNNWNKNQTLKIYQGLSALQKTLEQDLVKALGIMMSFNSSDGDS